MPILSIVIPCYNEEKRLCPEKLINFLQQKNNVNFVFVNDGSTDNSNQILESIRQQCPDRVTLINKEKKEGKAESVRKGLLESSKNNNIFFHGFMDADLAVSPEEFFRLYEILSATDKKFITGSRIKKLGASISRNEWRHFFGRIIATLVGFTTKLDIYDTQCSAKIFHKQLIPDIFGEKFKTKWLFDVELICRIHKQAAPLQQVAIEEPLLKWTEVKGSKLKWYDFFQIVWEIYIIGKYYRNKQV